MFEFLPPNYLPHKFVSDGDRVLLEIYSNGAWQRTPLTGGAGVSFGIRALLARDAQWREAWTELMELAREIEGQSNTSRIHQWSEKLDALQRRVDAVGGTT